MLMKLIDPKSKQINVIALNKFLWANVIDEDSSLCVIILFICGRLFCLFVVN